MARIVLIVGPYRGLLNSTLVLGRRLVAAGHTVTLATPDSDKATGLGPGLTSAGLNLQSWTQWRQHDRQSSGRLRRVRSRRAAALAALTNDELERLLADTQAELALIDVELHGQILRAQALLPNRVALLNPFVSIWRRPGLPPAHLLSGPTKGIRWHWQWGRYRLRKLTRRLRLALRDRGCPDHAVLADLEASVGPAKTRDASHWLMPWIYPQLPVLSLQALEFEFPHQPAPGVVYVGPQVESEGQPNGETLVDDRLESLLNRANVKERQERWIYAGFGSFLTTSPQLLRELIEAVRPRNEWNLILSLGGQAENLDPSPLTNENTPDNVHLFDWVPQPRVLSAVDAAVVHGGAGTAAECLQTACPMLIYCGHQTDMAGVASRAVFHGIALLGEPSDRAAAIGRRLDSLLTDPLVGQRSRALADLTRRYRDEQLLETCVTQLLEGGVPSTDLAPAREYWSTVPKAGFGTTT